MGTVADQQHALLAQKLIDLATSPSGSTSPVLGSTISDDEIPVMRGPWAWQLIATREKHTSVKP